MIFLILSILTSSFIFVIFRLFKQFEIDTFQAIVFNYVTAFCFGFLLYGSELKPEAFEHLEWIPAVITCGCLFISIFLVLGLSSQKNGVALTSVSVKMSMAMTLILMIIWYGESLTLLRMGGIILAILGVMLMSWKKKNASLEAKPIIWMLLFLFIGSGALDFALNFTQKNLLTHLPSSLFSAIGFGISAIIGFSILSIRLYQKKSKLELKNLLAGIGLGIPNFFSIYLLMKSYTEMQPWSDSTVLAITNVSVVLISAIFGFLIFREKFNNLKAFGLIASVSAIVVLYLATL